MSERNPKSTAPKTALEAVDGVDLAGKVYLVTGAYSGLGAATTKALLSAGALVIVAGRDRQAQEDFARTLSKTTKSNETAIDPTRIDASHTVDLGSLASVTNFAQYVKANYERIDCLINNAGIMNTPPGKTQDGFEIQMGTNVIGHFLLAKLLVDITKRQVWLSSEGHKRSNVSSVDHDAMKSPRIDLDAIRNVNEATYEGWMRYQQSKLGDILLAKQFAREYDHISTCSVHPGIVMTNLARHTSLWDKLKFVIGGLFGRVAPMANADQGARTQTLCAIIPEEELVNGAYYADCDVSEEAMSAKNMDDAKLLFDYCEEATAVFQR